MRTFLFAFVAVSSWAVEPCVKCHSSFNQPQVVREKQTVMIQRVRSNQMPPGSTLTDTEKQRLIQQIIRKAKSN